MTKAGCFAIAFAQDDKSEMLRDCVAQDDVCSVILRPAFLAEGSRLAPKGRKTKTEILRFAQDDKSGMLRDRP
jgi:DNA-binding transcriptional regulator WhiA